MCVVYICSDETMTEPVRPDDEVCVYRWRSMNFWQWPVCCVYLQWRNNDRTGMTWRWGVCWLFICSDGTMTEYDLMTMTCLRVLRGHKGPVRAIQVGICLCVWLGLVVGWLVSWRTDDWIADFWVKAMTYDWFVDRLFCLFCSFSGLLVALFLHSLFFCSPYFIILWCIILSIRSCIHSLEPFIRSLKPLIFGFRLRLFSIRCSLWMSV